MFVRHRTFRSHPHHVFLLNEGSQSGTYVPRGCLSEAKPFVPGRFNFTPAMPGVTAGSVVGVVIARRFAPPARVWARDDADRLIAGLLNRPRPAEPDVEAMERLAVSAAIRGRSVYEVVLAYLVGNSTICDSADADIAEYYSNVMDG